MKNSIRTEEFRVPPGVNVKLKEWPTRVKPIYKSKKRYHKLLEEQVDELNSLQRLHYASNRYALLLIFQGMDACRKQITARCGDGRIAQCSSTGCEGGGDIRRQLATIQETIALPASSFNLSLT